MWCGASFVWVWFAVPETKGRSLEDMDRLFKDRAAVGDKMRRKEIVRALKEQDRAADDQQEHHQEKPPKLAGQSMKTDMHCLECANNNVLLDF